MKILLISNMYPSTRNPTYGIFIKNIYNLLKEHHDIKLVVLKKHKNKLVKSAAYLIFYIKAVMTGIIHNYDCIYAHYISHCVWPVWVIKLFRRNIIVVGNVHGEDVFSDFIEFQENRKNAYKFMEKADYLIAPSQYFKERISKSYGFSLDKIFVSPSGGINTKVFYPDNQSKCREYLGLEQSAYYMGYVSRIEKGKGWDTFLKTFYNIKQKGVIKDVKAIIVGSGSEEECLTEMVKSLNIGQYIKFYPLVSQQELHYLYNSFSVFCFPTRISAESLGLVGLEAMACGLPCVISNAGGPMSYVEEGKNALLFDKNSEEDLEKKIVQFYEMDFTEKQVLIYGAYETAKKYSIEIIQKQLLNFFEIVARINR